ncbi:MAG: hypothetical protein DME40_20010, partial [Verrucomicrobia bacterium]
MGNGSGFPYITGGLDVLDGNFHHIAGSWDGSTMWLYVDGAVQGTVANSTPANNTRALNVGFAWGAGTPLRFFRGIVDELEIFSRALSQAEIQAIYGAGSAGKCKPQCTSPPPDMVSWWPGDGNANDIQDSNNGTLQNGATFAAGKVGLAFSFDGVDDYVDVGTNIGSIGGDISVVTWIKAGPNPFYQFVAGNRTPTLPDKGWELACLGDGDGGTIQFQASGGAHGYRTGLSNTRDNHWHHVVGVRAGGTYSVYVDGVIENGTGFSDASD